MEQLFQSWLRALLISGCICSFVLFVNPNGKMKMIMETGCASLMILIFLQPFGNDANPNLLMQEISQWTSVKACNLQDINIYQKTYMEQEYCAYIESEASRNGIAIKDITVDSEQNESGEWMPSCLSISTIKSSDLLDSTE